MFKKKKKKTGCCWSAAEMTFQITLEVDAISFSKITAIAARAGRRRTDLLEVQRRAQRGDLPSRQLHSLRGHVLNISLSKDIRQCCLTHVLLQLHHKEIRIMNLYKKIMQHFITGFYFHIVVSSKYIPSRIFLKECEEHKRECLDGWKKPDTPKEKKTAT